MQFKRFYGFVTRRASVWEAKKHRLCSFFVLIFVLFCLGLFFRFGLLFLVCFVFKMQLSIVFGTSKSLLCPLK